MSIRCTTLKVTENFINIHLSVLDSYFPGKQELLSSQLLPMVYIIMSRLLSLKFY